MTRMQPNTIVVKPSNNVFTALLGVGVVLQLIAVIVLFVQYNAHFGKQLFGQ